MAQFPRANLTPITPVRRELIEDDESLSLPLEGSPELLPHGVILRLPVRAEQVTVHKQAFVVEEAVVRADRSGRVVRIEEDFQREELVIDASGSAQDGWPARRPRLDHHDRPLL